MSTINARLQHWVDTTVNWTTNNPILASGQFGIDSDLGIVKTGDGVTAWNSLSYPGEIKDWTPVLTGYSVDPTISYARYQLIGKSCKIWLRLAFNSGTSNATTLTFTVPFTAKYDDQNGVLTRMVDNGAAVSTPGFCRTNASSTTVNCFKTMNGAAGAWTAANGKTFNLFMEYEIE